MSLGGLGAPAVVPASTSLDYNEAISGPRIVDGAEGFAEYMRSFAESRPAPR